jgi:hypothetical protein
MYDERMFFNPAIPPYGLTEVFGYREGESFYMETSQGKDSEKLNEVPASDRVYVEGYLQFTEPLSVRVKAHTFLTPITVSSAEVIAKYEDTPVAAMKRIGQGQVYYCGTNLGGSIQAGDPGGLQLISTILRRVVKAQVTADKLRPRLIEDGKQSLLVVVNDSVEDQTDSIALPPRYSRAINLYTKETQAINAGHIRTMVPFESVCVFGLQ